MKRSAISILRALRQSSIRTIFHRVSTKVDRTRGINSVRIRSFHSFGRLSLWREIERERKIVSRKLGGNFESSLIASLALIDD